MKKLPKLKLIGQQDGLCLLLCLRCLLWHSKHQSGSSQLYFIFKSLTRAAAAAAAQSLLLACPTNWKVYHRILGDTCTTLKTCMCVIYLFFFSSSQSDSLVPFTASSGSALPPYYHTLCVSFNPHWSVHFFYTSIIPSLTFLNIPSHPPPHPHALIPSLCCSPLSFHSLSLSSPSFLFSYPSLIHNCITCSFTHLYTSLHPHDGFFSPPLCAHLFVSICLPLVYPSVRQKL